LFSNAVPIKQFQQRSSNKAVPTTQFQQRSSNNAVPTTQFQQRSRNYEIGITKFQLRSYNNEVQSTPDSRGKPLSEARSLERIAGEGNKTSVMKIESLD